jgi:acetyl esterase/lipase
MKSTAIKLYQDREDVILTTYILEDSVEMLKGKPRPAVIICPGGAYLSCSDREGEPVAIMFANMGYHAFVLRYSTYCQGGTKWPDFSKPLPVKEYCRFPAAMCELGQSMLILREHAEEWHIDAGRIAVCGFSAGGHNAAMYATNWDSDLISEYFREGKEKFRPAAAILGYPLSDYRYMNEEIRKGNPGMAMVFNASNVSLLGTDAPSAELLDRVSPARYVSENTPPMFIWSTAEDNLVPVQHSIRMANALADKRIPFELHIFEQGAHGLSLATQASAEARSQLVFDVARWTELAGRWLNKRFALDITERTEMEIMMERGF